jgi:hypothetical protein
LVIFEIGVSHFAGTSLDCNPSIPTSLPSWDDVGGDGGLMNFLLGLVL